MYNDTRPLFLLADDKRISEDNRVRVRGRSNLTLLPDFFVVDIYNISDDELAILRDAKKLFVHTDMFTLVCSGSIEGIYTYEESSNIVTEVSISDGAEFWSESARVSVGAGAWMKDAIKSVLKGVDFGTFLCKDVRLQRGQTFDGSIPDIINSIAKTVKARAYVTHGVLHFIDGSVVENIFTIDEDDVLSDSSTMDEAIILKTIVKGYSVGDVIEYRNSKYRIIVQAIDLDNYSGEWSLQLTLIPETNFQGIGMEGGW